MRLAPALLLPLGGLLLLDTARAEPPARPDPRARPAEPAPAARAAPRPAPGRAAPARPAAEAEPRGEYAGVSPGLPRMPRIRLPRDAARTCYVTWMGFQLTPTGSQLFVQANQPLMPQLTTTPSRITVHLPGCRLASARHARPLDLRYFATPLAAARLVAAGPRGVSLVAELRQPATPQVRSRQLQSWYYAFVELRHAQVVPAVVARPAPRRAARDSRRRPRPAAARSGPEQP
jgi:hypothetical protein